LIGVISILYQPVGDGYMKTMGSFDLAFTPGQWQEAVNFDTSMPSLIYSMKSP